LIGDGGREGCGGEAGGGSKEGLRRDGRSNEGTVGRCVCVCVEGGGTVHMRVCACGWVGGWVWVGGWEGVRVRVLVRACV
jgi:hypothetical protein